MRPGNQVELSAAGDVNTASPQVRPWRHPQAWVPLELSFYFFIAPFLFWPAAVALLALQMFSQDLDGMPISSLKGYQLPTVTFIMTADGMPMAEIYREHRLVVPLDYMPRHVVDAFVAAEDSSFFRHQGIDLVGIGRALLANVRTGQPVQGASTITQQMIRNFLLSNEKSYERKVKEVILAWRAERLLTKDEILHLYLNQIFLGRGAYGVESAARLYFGKSIRDVNLAEAAMLAGLGKAPGRYRAHEGTEASRDRQRYVLNRMYAEGYITREEGLRALATPLRFLERRPNHYREVEPMFSEVVRQQVAQEFGADAVLNGGLRIWTTLDPRVQAMAERAVRDGLNALARRQRMSPVQASLDDDQARLWNRRARESIAQRPLLPDQEPAGLVTGFSGDPGIPGTFLAIGGETGFLPAGESAWIAGRRKPSDFFRLNDLVMVRLVARDPATGIWILETAPPPEIQGALVLIENATGKVLAMVGGRDFGIEGVGNSDFNRAVLALRQPGSSFKPFVYAAAIDNGYTEASVVYDEPVSYPDGSGRSWSPRNYGGGHAGPITLYEAIKRSVNVVAVKLCDALGPQTVIGYARRMGITSELTPSLSLALGASEVTLLDLAKAYTTFPNQGSWVWPTFVTRVEDRFGRPLLVPEPYFTEAISPQTAYIMVDMLTGVATRGTAARVGAALRGVPVAGKTGTTNSLADALFVGFTPRYTCGVWVGRETRVTLGSGEQGGRTAAPIFIEFMKGFLEGQEPGRFEVPDGVVRRRLLDPEEEDYDLGAGVSYVFRLGEEGQGRHSDTPRWDEDYAADEGPQDAPALSQEEMDRRLEAYLAGYQAF